MKPNLAKILDEGFRTKHNRFNDCLIYRTTKEMIFYNPKTDEIEERVDIKDSLERIRKSYEANLK